MAKCPYCNNDCEEYYIESIITVCPECESKSVGQTNEEWFDTLSTTEEKADAIYECVMANFWSFSKDGIKRWLKQPRTPIS